MFVAAARLYLLDILGRHSVSAANLLCWIMRQRLICCAGAGLERDSGRYNPASSGVHAEERLWAGFWGQRIHKMLTLISVKF